MAQVRDILTRTKAVRNVRRVTKTMEMVATARFQKSRNRTVALRSYTNRLAELTGDVVARGTRSKAFHPLLLEHEQVKRDVLLIITSDRGMCGPYNTSVLRIAMERLGQLLEAEYHVELHVVGRKGIQYLEHRGLVVDVEYAQFEGSPVYEHVSALTDGFIEEFLAAQIGGLEVAYMQFISSGRRRPAIAQILPLSNLPTPPRLPTLGEPAAYELCPSGDEILARLLPATVRMRMYQCFLDAAVCEQFERIAAMRSATENADEMIHDLTVRYNRIRQAQITTELTEIMGGRMGVR